MKIRFFRKFFNIFTSLLLLLNAFNPYFVASVYAQDVPPVTTETEVISNPAPTVAVTIPVETTPPATEPTDVTSPETLPSTSEPTTVEVTPTVTVGEIVAEDPEVEVLGTDAETGGEAPADENVTDPLEFDLADPVTSEESAQATSVVTDKADYTPTELVTITGTGYVPGVVLIVEVLVDGVVFSSGETLADENGEFIYPYQLDGTYRPYYEVVIRSESGEVLAETSFTDSVEDKIKICHKTSSTVNPWNAIEVGSPSLPRHFGHGDYLYTGPHDLGPIHNGNEEQMRDADRWCQENDPSLCGNGALDTDETCDYGAGYNGGQSSCSLDCQLRTVEESCAEGEVIPSSNIFVDIDGGNGESYSKTDWDPATGSETDPTYGGWDNDQLIGMVVGPEKCDSDESAQFVVGEAGKYITQLQVRALDGISYTDSFDVYLNDIFLAHYEDNNAGGENWDTLIFPVPGPDGHGVQGPVTVKFYSVDDPWEDCQEWGQVAINWTEISGYSCSQSPSPTPTPTSTPSPTPTPTSTLTPTPTATVTPIQLCGNGELDGDEDCDYGNRNGGESSCTLDCEWRDVAPECEKDQTPLPTYESVDIDGLNDGFYSKTFWSPATGLSSGATYGDWDEHEEIGMVVSPGDCDTSDRTADFTIGEAGKYITELQIRALDGISFTDSFDIYINDLFLAHYEDNDKGGEVWDTLTYPVPGTDEHGVEGPVTVRFESVDDPWSSCDTWGQVAVNWVDVGQYVCEREPIGSVPQCGDPEYATGEYNDVNIGDEADEASYHLSYWGPVEPDASSGNWGEGTACEDGNCRVIFAPDEEDPHNRIAVFSMELGTSQYKEMRFRALDGISGTDSFEIYVDGEDEPIYRWLDNGISGGDEIWGDHRVDVSDYHGEHTFTLRSIDTKWGSYPTYGQVAFTNIGIWNYECEPEPVCGNNEMEEGEDCDGTEGVTAGVNFCTPNCQLIPIYDGGHSCPAGTASVKLGDYTISSIDPDGEIVPLETGKTYLFEASGTYLYNKSNENNAADAAYGTRDGWSSVRSDIGIWGTNRGVTSIIGDLGNGIGVIEWDENTSFDTDHIYQKVYTAGSDFGAKFLISDWYSNWYGANCQNQSCMGDNSGGLTLTVFECEEIPSRKDIQGYKWHDEDGDRTTSCELNLATEDPDDEICEPNLEGWKIFIDSNENGVFDEGEPFDITDEDGGYSFDDLPIDTYRVCEVQQEGWVQTYPYGGCYDIELPLVGCDVQAAQPLSRFSDYVPECSFNFGNAEIGIDLEKEVSATSSVGPSSTVTYTLTVTNTGDIPLSGVYVKDALPGGFTYVPDSSELTYLGSTSDFDDPTVDGTGALVWTIGDLLPGEGESKTITYNVTLSADLYSGIYTNIAVAVGYYKGISQDVASSGVGGLLDLFKVEEVYAQTTESQVVAGPKTATVTVDRSLAYSASVGGEVLGASTEVLPATGSNTTLLYIFLALAVAGVALKLFARKGAKFVMKLARVFAMIALIGAMLTGNALAFADTISIQDLPEYTNTDTFRVSYSALSDSAITVKFYILRDGKSEWKEFGGTQTGASGWVQVSGSDIYDGDGKYYIKSVMQVSGASDETSTFVDRSGPSPVSNYWKERIAGGFYKLHWKNPHDDDFSRVMIYRSESSQFTADGTTKVYEIGGNKEEEMYWDNVGLDSNKEYFYAIRALDKAGNASSIVADPETTVTSSSTTPAVVYGEGTGGGFLLPDEDDTEDMDEESGDVLGDENEEEGTLEEDEDSIADQGVFQRAATFARERTKITVGIVAIVGVAYLAYKKFSEGSTKKK